MVIKYNRSYDPSNAIAGFVGACVISALGKPSRKIAVGSRPVWTRW